MDNTQLKSIQDALNHYAYFFEILKNGIERYNKDQIQENLDEVKKRLINQHTMNRITLETLGHSFDEHKIIKDLNKKIYSLEKSIGYNDNTDLKKISQFSQSLSAKIKSELETELGLYCFPKVIISDAITISLEHLRCYIPAKEWDYKYAENDQEKFEIINKYQKAYDLNKNVFETLDDGEIIFNNENNDVLIKIIENYFSKYGKVSNLEKNLVNYSKNNKYEIKNVKFNIITLDSNLNIIEQFKSMGY